MKNLSKITIISVMIFFILITTTEMIWNIQLSQVNRTIYLISIIIVNLLNLWLMWELNDKASLNDYKDEEEKKRCIELRICCSISMILSFLYILFSNHYIAIFLLVFYISTVFILLDLIKTLKKGVE